MNSLIHFRSRAVLVSMLLLALTACASAPLQCVPSADLDAVKPIQASTGQTQLQEAVRLYDSADYPAVIQKLQASSDIWSDAASVRVSAYKYLAFSYCATSRRALCKQAFASLLKVDPGFELRPTEAGHPIWGPVFTQARRESAAAVSTSPGSPAGSSPRS